MELALIFLVIFFLFGAKRLPEIARGLGESIKEFKRSITDVGNKMDKDKE